MNKFCNSSVINNLFNFDTYFVFLVQMNSQTCTIIKNVTNRKNLKQFDIKFIIHNLPQLKKSRIKHF